MKKLFLFAFGLLLFISGTAYAALPVLNFSDLTSGPKTGLGDGLGSGVIVTIWGNNLGSTQGTSKVYVGNVEAAYVYEWTDATQHPGHPANLYTYHKMQTIAFSVPATALDGVNTIKVVVNGDTSNTLPFTIRSGDIRFIKTTGNNSNAGTWAAPFLTLDYVGTGAGGKFTAGATIYAGNGVTDTDCFIVNGVIATAANPISVIAYPGSTVIAQGNGCGIGHWAGNSAYWSFSKLSVKSNGNGIDTFKGMRAVANEITNLVCANGQGGAISGSDGGHPLLDTVSDIKAFGNYIHDWGCDSTSKLHHVFYISNRSGNLRGASELGWNYLTDNMAHHALHNFDEGICGDLTGILLMHDNVVKNQVGVGVGVASGGTDPCYSMPVEIYNNLFINVGLETTTCGGAHNQAVSFGNSTTHSAIKYYNNTLYGYGVPGSGHAINVQGTGAADWVFGGTWEFRNNIIVDTNNLPYEYPTFWKPADVKGNNLWYNGGDGNPASPPSWDTAPLTSDPLFVNQPMGDYKLEGGSPAKGTGTSAVGAGLKDLLGKNRPMPNYSIGAFEAASVAPAPPTGKQPQ